MEKNLKNQITRIIIGLFLMFLGFYFLYLRFEYIITSLVSTSGLVLLISGISYKQRANRKKLTGEERRAYVRSAHFIISIIGFGIVLIGLGGGLIVNYIHPGATAIWFLIPVFVGMFIMLVGRLVRVADESKK
jgi:hypothetical protein